MVGARPSLRTGALSFFAVSAESNPSRETFGRCASDSRISSSSILRVHAMLYCGPSSSLLIGVSLAALLLWQPTAHGQVVGAPGGNGQNGVAPTAVGAGGAGGAAGDA
ncbi:hypothetical protein, partial [Salinarimonas sp. NSM]|uniref:hypothetical protein n=1 Tax=Salinarimonas sp. NSM TaxID=3458003 RepID=UPI00403735D9